MEKYPGLTYGFEGRRADREESTQSMYSGLAMAMMVVYCLLAIPFRSFVQPIVIMSSIPFGIIGAVLGHIIMGYSLSMMSLFGMVALTGVVINDSLVLINFTNRERENGAGPVQALATAAVMRFRPILLTSLTTFGALMPMIFETSRQAKFMIPMAISLGFGVIFATGITLVIIPCLYHIVEDIRSLMGFRNMYPSPKPTGTSAVV
jgi:multidrug efflux pump subunit AcrB